MGSAAAGTLTVGMVVVWVCVADGSTDEGTVETTEDGVTSARASGDDDGAAVLVDALGDDAVADGDVSVVDGAGDPDAGDDDVDPGVSDGDVVSDGDGLVLDGAEVDGVLVGDDVSDPLVVLEGLLCVAGTSGKTIGGALGGTVAFGSRFSTFTDNCCS